MKKMKCICKTNFFTNLVEWQEYNAEDERTQEFVLWKKKQEVKNIEMIAIRINWILQRFQKKDFQILS